MYKTEVHMHTYPVSACSKLTPTEQVRLFKEAGYDTVFVSDHFSAHHFKKLGEHLTFAEKVDKLCDAYLEAKAEGDRIGLTVLFSVELSFHKNHYLLYGVTREMLKLREDIFDIDIDESLADWSLPALSLQPLIGNAVKHNTITKKRPFTVSIRTEGTTLVVENRKAPKLEAEPSTGIGLQNLQSRWHLITGQDIEIVDGEEFFTVRMPLQKPGER